ncbi:fructose bisphosphate aldolase [Sphingorhabdus lutea]|uniref:fructose-bisphosphate aldolase n=1 Tax=Sphingorhabdus lutea TaxID=1913578 RepID=A0A1L3JBZ2_9SPHN|nr:fructose bisphosphate aldolase [Sphingorhabdus lutea]APG62583.1 fructose bisphosphate aldolase [Sphingorhabdus lutea]
MQNSQMTDKIATGIGFIAALDQSGGSTPKALAGYGIKEDAYSNDDEMFGLIHEMRVRIMTSPSFNGERVLGAILFEKTMDGQAGGMDVPEYLWSKAVVPFLKVDKGLEDEVNGVQMMKPMPDLAALCARGVSKGVYGTKMRSVINLANKEGIAAIVNQQFDVAGDILSYGLMPMIEPEISIKSADRAQCDAILADELKKHLDTLPKGTQVMLKLSIPQNANIYADIVNHPAVLRLVALSGGFSTDEACTELAKNKGMIASFSRALLEKLQHGLSDDEFDEVLNNAIAQIYAASAT